MSLLNQVTTMPDTFVVAEGEYPPVRLKTVWVSSKTLLDSQWLTHGKRSELRLQS